MKKFDKVKIHENVSLDKFTTYRLPAKTKYLAYPENVKELVFDNKLVGFCSYDFSRENYTRFITVLNADVTGTNEYSLVIITRDTEEECFDELDGQLSDGIFENSRTGFVKEVDLMNYRG